jgi:hypothetical protein
MAIPVAITPDLVCAPSSSVEPTGIEPVTSCLQSTLAISSLVRGIPHGYCGLRVLCSPLDLA